MGFQNGDSSSWSEVTDDSKPQRTKRSKQNMMKPTIKPIFLALLLAQFAYLATSECANGCSGHGKCTSYDMCICNRNWQANDCSERVCQFGLAHVDTPKGDLDMDGEVNGPGTILAQNHPSYPYGTTEQFPPMQDSALTVLDNTAHYYMECSNKGKCDRATGECQCFDGYDGVACQRASCPGYPQSCSGHGVCKSISQLAATDNGNYYKLWDQDSTMGCDCDSGYSGADCSQRSCKYGIDPLYLDDTSTIKFSTWDIATLGYTQSDVTTNSLDDGRNLFSDGMPQSKTGYWAIRFFDHHGEDWVTSPIPAGASCETVVAALEALPNDVIPADSVYCTLTSNTVPSKNFSNYDAQHPADANWGNLDSRPVSNHPYHIFYNLAIWDAVIDPLHGELAPNLAKLSLEGSLPYNASNPLYGYIYRLKFFGNPGKLQEPVVELHLDGTRPSLDVGVVAISSTSTNSNTTILPDSKVITKVWTDGQQGEDDDFFADHCDGVSVVIRTRAAASMITNISESEQYVSFLTGFTTSSKQLLKTCLGDADFDTSNNEEIHNWDKGSKEYPHLIKLVRSITTYTDGGYYAAIWYDETVFWDNIDVGSPEETYVHPQSVTGQSTKGTFRLLNPFVPPDAADGSGGWTDYHDRYEVYTTKGTLALTSNSSRALFSFGSKNIYTTNTSLSYESDYYDGDISCEIGNNNAGKMAYIAHCLNKTDHFTMLNWEYPEMNPKNLNLYTATRLTTMETQHDANTLFSLSGSPDLSTTFMTHIINTDISTNWGVAISHYLHNAIFHVYKFFPATSSTYQVVSQCSNRGLCDNSMGVCNCFGGYTSDSCSEQSALHM